MVDYFIKIHPDNDLIISQDEHMIEILKTYGFKKLIG
jgi:hypothetical protein